MIALVLGGLALVVAITMLRWFAGADPKALVKGLRYFGAGVLLLAAVGLAAVDRVSLAMLAGSMAWGLFTGGHVWPGGWPYSHRPSGTTANNNTVSRVKTKWLDMELDHASGKMTGRVLEGDLAGDMAGDLEGHSKGTLARLFRAFEADDSESARLLEAYLDRRFGPDWRTSPEFAAPASSGMTREEAYAVLGLGAGVSQDEIRAAHRRLILQNHPDKGGSDYLAAKINEAKDVLLEG
jgi:hypothetical protein